MGTKEGGYRAPEAEVVVFGSEFVACGEYSWHVGDGDPIPIVDAGDGDDDFDFL